MNENIFEFRLDTKADVIEITNQGKLVSNPSGFFSTGSTSIAKTAHVYVQSMSKKTTVVENLNIFMVTKFNGRFRRLLVNFAEA